MATPVTLLRFLPERGSQIGEHPGGNEGGNYDHLTRST